MWCCSLLISTNTQLVTGQGTSTTWKCGRGVHVAQAAYSVHILITGRTEPAAQEGKQLLEDSINEVESCSFLMGTAVLAFRLE